MQITRQELETVVGNALHEVFGPHPPEDRSHRADAFIDALATVGLKIVSTRLDPVDIVTVQDYLFSIINLMKGYRS